MIAGKSLSKGISPLIAAVILMAFVIAVASIVATFFTDMAEEWGEGIGDEDPVGMIFTDVEIVEDRQEQDDIIVRNTGDREIEGFVVTLYNDDVLSEEFDESLGPGMAGTLDLVGTDLEGELENADRVEVAPVGAPGRSDEKEISDQ